jgi:hypothetical protein
VRVAYHLRNNAWVYEPLERDRVPGRAIGANGSGDWAYDPDFAGGTYRDEAPGGGIVTPGAGSAGYGHGQRPLEGRPSGSGNPGHSEAGSGAGLAIFRTNRFLPIRSRGLERAVMERSNHS